MTDEWGDPDPARAWQEGAEVPDAGQWSYFPPRDQAATPWTPPAPSTPRERLRRLPGLLRPHAAVLAATTAVLTLLGAPLALAWRAVAPTAVVLQTAQGPQPEAPESSQVFAVDGWFVVVMLVAGSVLGAVAWFALRERGPGGPLGLAGGGLLASSVAAAVGKRMVVDRYLYDFCHQPDVGCIVYDGTLHLHATAAVVVLPVAMLTGFVLMTFFVERDLPALPPAESDPLAT